MKTTVSRAAAAAVLGLFCLSAIPPAPAFAQDRAQATEKKMAKKAVKKAKPSKSVMSIQAALNKTGAKLKVDGLMGKGTRAALKKYQAANGLKATGRADRATRTKLGV